MRGVRFASERATRAGCSTARWRSAVSATTPRLESSSAVLSTSILIFRSSGAGLRANTPRDPAPSIRGQETLVSQEPHDLVAPYALDALDDHERAAFERHLDECER